MSRFAAIDRAQRHFDEGHFQQTLARRVAAPTESQNPERAEQLQAYLTQEMQPAFEAMGFSCRLLQHPKAKAPFSAANLAFFVEPVMFSNGLSLFGIPN